MYKKAMPTILDETRLAVEREYSAAKDDFDAAHQALVEYNRTHIDSRIHVLNCSLYAQVNVMNCAPSEHGLKVRELTRNRASWRMLHETRGSHENGGIIH